jgi:hypothetical protein
MGVLRGWAFSDLQRHDIVGARLKHLARDRQLRNCSCSSHAGFGVQGSGFGVQGSGFGVEGTRSGVEGVVFRF